MDENNKKSTRATVKKPASRKPARKPAPKPKIQETKVPDQVPEKVETEEIPSLGDQKIQDVAPKTVIKPFTTRSTNFDIIVNGKQRNVSRLTYETLSKDQHRYNIELPEDSPLKLIELDPKPCKDC